jgi:DNA-binding LacI/PurR family transcriptional regulator
MVSSTEYWTDELAAYQAVADNWRVDGVILSNVVYRPAPSAAELAILKQGIPCVFINKYLRARAVDSVSVDNAAAVRLAVDHLVELGHRRIGILNGSRLAVDGVERLVGFRRALARKIGV